VKLSPTRRLGAVAAAALLTLAACGQSAQEDDASGSGDTEPEISLEGETLRVIINFSAGGPTDTFGRLITKHLTGHLPGEPNIVVENVPGADGALGSNRLWDAEPDGLTFGILTDPMLPTLLPESEVNYDMAEWTWVGGISETMILFSRADLGLETAEDLIDFDGEVVAGGYGPRSDVDLGERLFFDTLGVEYNLVTGYPGGNDALAALDRNEINTFLLSLSTYVPRVGPQVEDGSVVELAQAGAVNEDGEVIRDERFPDLPTMHEVLEEHAGSDYSEVEQTAMAQIVGTLSLLRAIVAPPGVPEENAEVLRTGLSETLADPAFQDEAEQLLGYELFVLTADEAKTISDTIVQSAEENPDAIDYLAELVGAA
jgi:tripartite-type tricarboxylate transporter receptor subunit TctC